MRVEVRKNKAEQKHMDKKDTEETKKKGRSMNTETSEAQVKLMRVEHMKPISQSVEGKHRN